MKITSLLSPISATALCALALLTGCGESKDADPVKTQTPAQAGSQLEQAFQNANGAGKDSAKAAAEAMRQGEYEKAVVSLHTAKSAPNVSLEQGMAIQSSMISLEQNLIKAIERGDPNAQRAYDLLKRSKRN